MRIDVRHNFGEIGKKLDRLADTLRDEVLAQTLNTLAKDAQSKMAAEIAAEFNITRREAMDGLRMDRAKVSAGKSFMMARIYAPARKKGRGFNLIRFLEKKVTFAEARRRQKGGTLQQLRVKIKRSGGLKVLPGAFIANKGRTVFVRVGKDRLPIKALTTVDIAQMFNTQRVNARVVDYIKANAAYVLRDKIAMLIKR